MHELHTVQNGDVKDVLVDVVVVVEVITHTDADTDPGDPSNILFSDCLAVSDSTQ